MFRTAASSLKILEKRRPLRPYFHLYNQNKEPRTIHTISHYRWHLARLSESALAYRSSSDPGAAMQAHNNWIIYSPSSRKEVDKTEIFARSRGFFPDIHITHHTSHILGGGVDKPLKGSRVHSLFWQSVFVAGQQGFSYSSGKPKLD